MNKLGKNKWFYLLLLLVFLLTTPSIYARFGGGHSFSSGGSGGYSGGGYSSGRSSSSYSSSSRYSSSGGGGDGAWVLMGILWYFPEIFGMILMAFIANHANYHLPKRPPDLQTQWDVKRLQSKLNAIRQQDPNFSKVLFLDFARLLYHRWYANRGTHTDNPQELYPFLSKTARIELDELRNSKRPKCWCEIQEVNEIIVGAADVVDVDLAKDWTSVRIKIVANYVQKRDEKGEIVEKGIIENDEIILRRKSGVLSQAPESMRALHCPSCGAPVQTKTDGCCEYCGAPPKPGEEQWELLKPPSGHHRLPRDYYDKQRPDARKAVHLWPLEISEAAQAGCRDLVARDPQFSVQKFIEHAKEVFVELQTAWTSLEWDKTRPLMTSALWEANLMWIEKYRRTKQRNYLDDMEIDEITPVAFESDAFYDTVTVAFDAKGKDYTVDGEGKVLSGSKSVSVPFREYWTFIRRKGHESDEIFKRHCPNCGSPVAAAKMQECPSCDGLLSSSEFDWTLAYVSQSSVYFG